MGKPSPQEVASRAKILGRDLSTEQAKALSTYLEALMKWNRSVNLVATSKWQQALDDLMADSWHLADYLGELPLVPSPRSLDFGAGAGLPGIPLRMFWSQGHYTLVEIRSKRVAFMRYALSLLNLPETDVAGQRVEELPESLMPADLILSRAFMPWEGFLEVALPRLSSDGMCVVMANEPFEPDACPGQWAFYSQTAYPSGGKERYFWSFSPVSISM